jgi:HD-GYP domain-containing protein (c-di-GMP phosphodiesterase class II)
MAVGTGELVVAGPSVVFPLQRLMLARGHTATDALNTISHTDAARAATARTQMELGAAVAMLLLMAAFAFVYLRSTAAYEAVGRLVREKDALLGPSEASTESVALKVADDRLYANMASPSSTSHQVTDALLQVIAEQNVSLDEHVERVAEMAGVLAAALGESKGEVERIRLAAKLHDIGKVAIPAAVLDKPGPLEDREWASIHRHPVIGARIVSAAPALASTAPLINSSHERVDGQGYPDGLKGENIPFGSRIIAVCDAFEAMTSDRPYHQGVGIDEALAELTRRAGTHFDAAVVDAFCKTAVLHPRAPSAAAVPTGLVSAG